MKILSIETSCDETAIALVGIRERKTLCFEILSNIILSQVKIHEKWGGVWPTLAKREHQRNLLPVLRQALKQSKLLQVSKSGFLTSKQIQNSKFRILNSILEREPGLLRQTWSFLRKYQKPKIDFIAVTIGPGLEPCLWTGINFARALAFYWNLPIIPINHIEAHILVNFLNYRLRTPDHKLIFPAICLVVSGGHTQLILMKGFGKYRILGETRDDAAGECFDKTARILGLSYPGGPAIAAEAAKFKIQDSRFKIQLPRPMLHSKDYDFSFSGLKTAVLYRVQDKKKGVRDRRFVREMAFEIQQAIVDVLAAKTIKAAKEFKTKSIILGGGVAANDELRERSGVYGLKSNMKFLVPQKIFCTDNAAMGGMTAYWYFLKGKLKSWQNIRAKSNLRLI